jgi:large subunit ribosomal protein L6
VIERGDAFRFSPAPRESDMSRIGNRPIEVPKGVDLKIDGNTVTAKGPKGTLSRTFSSLMTIKNNNGVVEITRER